jgi:hypothetical protein
MRELEELVGDGKVVGRVTFKPQKIAVPQHRGTWMTGPLAGVRIQHWTTPGTGPEFLSGPLLERGEGYIREVARELLTLGPIIPMQRAMDDLRAEALRRVPRKTTVEPGEAFHHPVTAEVSG